jgi:hypothetical protein
MLPAIWPGDTLVVERAGSDEVQVGAVVLVGRGGRLCAHRVVSLTNPCTYLITQGDAMRGPDRPVIESELLGRVVYLIRAGKRVDVRTKLSVVELLIAKIVRRWFFAARVLVYLHGAVLVRTLQKSDPKEFVLPCQG